MRAAIYCRVSTSGQEDNFSLDGQGHRTKQWCQEKGYTVVAEFREVHSGADLYERPKLTELREMASKRLIDVVVATKLDRLSRDTIHQVVLDHELGLYDVAVEFTDEDFEKSAEGQLFRSIKGYVADNERKVIRERTMRGRRDRVREGLMIPSSIWLYGYCWADERKSRYVFHERYAPIVRRVWQEAAEGKPIRRIALDLTRDHIDRPDDAWRRERNDPDKPPLGRPWTRSSVYNILHNPAYWGEHSAFRWERKKAKSTVDPLTGRSRTVREWRERDIGTVRVPMPEASPAIVSPEMAQLVHERLAHSKEAAFRNNKNPESHLLRGGFIKCGMCGCNMKAHRSNNKPIYICVRSTKDALVSRPCTGTSPVMAEKIDAEVWGSVMTVLTNPNWIEQEMFKYVGTDSRQYTITMLSTRIKELDSEAVNLTNAIRTMGGKAGSDRLLEALEMTETEKQRTIQEVEKMQKAVVSQASSIERLRNVQAMVIGINRSNFDYNEKRAILYGLNLQVKVYPPAPDPESRLTTYEVTIGRNDEVLLPSNCVSTIVMVETQLMHALAALELEWNDRTRPRAS